ncbi:MAG TPA: cation diffusion facilitator family transporter [Chloroflexota bacterium]|nr:cation diffusion facilitator family transporter [Chloroflexota bacterium]
MDGHRHNHPHAHGGAGVGLWLKVALGLTVLFVVVEALAGYFANSLALLADAGHNLSDALAIGLSLWAFGLASQPASARRTYGMHRAGILAALGNGLFLVLIALGIFVEAFIRIQRPGEVQPDVIVVVAAAAVVVNLVIAVGLHGAAEHDLNVRSSYIHVAGDAASAAGVVLAGLLIALTGANWLDPLISVVIAVLILGTSVGIVREAVDILLEATPPDVDALAVLQAMAAVPGVIGVHDLHLWSVSSSVRAASAHVLVEDQLVSQACQIMTNLDQVLASRFQISHASLQMETTACHRDDIFCRLGEDESA